MRTSEERVQELHARMNTLTETKNRRRFILTSAAAFAVCIALTVAMALMISKLPVRIPGESGESAAASIFAEHEALGYVVIALLAFCLGSLVTIFCFRIKKHLEEKQNDDRHD